MAESSRLLGARDMAAMEAAGEALYGGHPGERLAPYLIALMLAICLQTVAVTQFVSWAGRSWHRESRGTRALAVWVIAAGLAYTGVHCARALDVFVFGFGHYASLVNTRKPQLLVLLMSCVHYTSEAYYIHRAWRLCNQNWWMLIAFGLFWSALVVFSVVTLIIFPNLSTTFVDHRSVGIRATVQAAMIAILDVLITLVTIYLLYRRRSKQADKDHPSERLIRRLIMLCAETQLPISCFAVSVSVCNAFNQIYYIPVGVALLCTLSQISLFKVFESKRQLRVTAGLTSINPSAGESGSTGISAPGPSTTVQMEYSLVSEPVPSLRYRSESCGLTSGHATEEFETPYTEKSVDFVDDPKQPQTV